jgi:hypothetical protein
MQGEWAEFTGLKHLEARILDSADKQILGV